MARQRNKQAQTQTVTPTHEGSNRNMAGALNQEQIDQLLGATRQKGRYIGCLNDFAEGNDMGVNVMEKWPEFAQKKASTVKQGFDNAKKSKDSVDAAAGVRVLSNENVVYLIRETASEEAA